MIYQGYGAKLFINGVEVQTVSEPTYRISDLRACYDVFWRMQVMEQLRLEHATRYISEPTRVAKLLGSTPPAAGTGLVAGGARVEE